MPDLSVITPFDLLALGLTFLLAGGVKGVIGMGLPNLASYEPAYVDELGVLMAHAFARMAAPDGGASYPITSYTWLLLYKRYDAAARRDAVRGFVEWGLGAGQEYSGKIGYIPLPASVAARARSLLASVE
mgnify:CR=1 FL=1